MQESGVEIRFRFQSARSGSGPASLLADGKRLKADGVFNN
jgi:hypothetical protein